MSKTIAFLFPGQGSQYPGMAKDFYETYAEAKAVFEEADEFLSEKISKLIFEGPADVLTQTKNSQLAIYIVSIAILRVIQKQFPDLKPQVCAGLSLGEYTALYASGRISFSEGLSLVRDRALYMQQACEEKEGSMRVVLGLESSQVEAMMQEISLKAEAWVANMNCPGQVVIAGTKEGLEYASEVLKAKGAKRILPLEVSGAFHSGLMKSARDKLSPKINSVSLSSSPIQFVMNVPGDYVTSSEEVRQFLIQQVTSPVRWEKGMRKMMEQGVDLCIEIGCGSALTGMNKKMGVPSSLSIQKISDLDELAKIKDTVCTC